MERFEHSGTVECDMTFGDTDETRNNLVYLGIIFFIYGAIFAGAVLVWA